ncbi:MAG: N-acetylmuramoyl-L-alanine amidase [Oscillospiraceae bacterium]|nr:N-acetylmuramoyl-L-alanine amidase [Oscillospiraceae bacterium]
MSRRKKADLLLLVLMVWMALLLAGCAGEADRTASPRPSQQVHTASPTPEAVPTPTLTPRPTPSPAPAHTPEPTPTPLPLTGCIICVDPGHCVTPETGKGHRELVSPLSNETKPLYTTGTQGANLTEEALNLIVGKKLRDRLEALGATVVMTREVSDITISGIERCEIANQSGADVCVRIHADGSTDSSVHGVSVLVPAGDLLGTPSIVDESVRLGALMVDAVAEKTGAKNLGTIPRTDMTGFNFSEVPTVLIEMGFMTNAEEDARLETEVYQDQIADGITESLLSWYTAVP